VEAGSMAQAAAKLRVTQPSVSKAISDLEAALRVQLFERSTRGVTPTMYGAALMKCGTAVFDELKQGIRTIEFLADPTSGELRVGCLGAITATMVLPAAIERFGRQFPRVVLHVDDVASLPALLSGLRDRKYDLAITRSMQSLAHDSDDLSLETLFDDRMVVVAGARSRWATRRKIELEELLNEPWILSEPDTWNYARLHEACQAKGLPMPKATLLSLSVPLRAYLIAKGPYIAPLAEASMPLLNAEHRALKVLPVDLPDRPWPVMVAALKNRTQIPLVERFIECVREASKRPTPKSLT
jgi:DNA-binding transcriptional LysR family regulator